MKDTLGVVPSRQEDAASQADAPGRELDPERSEGPKDLAEQVREALLDAGFRWELWQKPERGQRFGMIRREGDMQLHVRYYEDGSLKAERELANDYVEHLLSPRESAHEEIEPILEEHGLEEDVEVQEKTFPARHRGGDMPSTRTPWKPLILGAGVALVGAIASRSFLPFGGD